MKLATSWKAVLLVSMVIFSQAASSATREEEEEKQCKKPKFRDFSPTQYSEVLPEAEISFHANKGTDPFSVTAMAKNEKLTVKVTNKVNYLLVTAKLPPSLREGFARIHVTAKAAEGGCLGQDGWLIKFKEAGKAAEPEKAS